jgi:hypothetical protein
VALKSKMQQKSGATEGSPRETLRNLLFKVAGLSGKPARAHYLFNYNLAVETVDKIAKNCHIKIKFLLFVMNTINRVYGGQI